MILMYLCFFLALKRLNNYDHVFYVRFVIGMDIKGNWVIIGVISVSLVCLLIINKEGKGRRIVLNIL